MRRLLQLFVLGCIVSLIVSSRLTLRLIAGGMVGWSIVPIVEWSVGLVAHPAEPINALGPAMLRWLLAIAAVLSFASPAQADRWSDNRIAAVAIVTITTLVLIRSAPRSTAALRVAVWAIVLVVVFAFAGWPIVANSLGLG